jgi:hypothetical protein
LRRTQGKIFFHNFAALLRKFHPIAVRKATYDNSPRRSGSQAGVYALIVKGL